MEDGPLTNTSRKMADSTTRSAWRKFLEATVLKKKWTRTEMLTSVCLYLHVLPWGLYCGALSTTLLDLEQLTNTTTAQIGLMFTACTFGALVGAPVGGLILSKINCRLYLGVICCLYGCTTTALPWARNFVTLMIIAVIHGVFQGALDTGQNVTALLIWGWDATSFLQAFHGTFAIGTFIGPWLSKPFLSQMWHEEVLENTTRSINGSIQGNTTEVLVMGTSRVYITYAIIGVLMFVSGITYFIVYAITRNDKEKAVEKSADKDKKTYISSVDRYRNPNQSKLWYMVPMAVMAFIRFGAYVGLELTYSGFLMTFTVKALGWEKSQGLAATTMYWGAFAGGRLVVIFLVLILSPTTILMSCMSIMLVSYMVLSIFVTYHPIVLVICSLAAGLSQASFYGCSMSWAYKYMKVSERVGTVFTSGAWAGMAGIPALAAYLIQSVEAVSFIYMCLGVVILLAIVTFIPTFIGLKYGTELPHKEDNKDEDAEATELTNVYGKTEDG